MNRQQRRRHKAIAADFARKLVAKTRDDDWQKRMVVYAAAFPLIEMIAGDEAHALSAEYATAVIKAFGSPPITCAEQLIIWGGSYEYQDEARSWLMAQGGMATITRGDGENCVLHELDGHLAFTPLPSAGSATH